MKDYIWYPLNGHSAKSPDEGTYLVKGGLQHRAPPVFIFEPAAGVLKLASELALEVHHVLNVHLKTESFYSLDKNTVPNVQ